MSKGDIIFVTICFIIISLQIGFSVDAIMDKTTESDELHNRLDALVKDSIKMHKWYENVELEYQELNNLKPTNVGVNSEKHEL